MVLENHSQVNDPVKDEKLPGGEKVGIYLRGSIQKLVNSDSRFSEHKSCHSIPNLVAYTMTNRLHTRTIIYV